MKEVTTKVYFGTSWCLGDLETQVLHSHHRSRSERAARKNAAASVSFGEYITPEVRKIVASRSTMFAPIRTLKVQTHRVKRREFRPLARALSFEPVGLPPFDPTSFEPTEEMFDSMDAVLAPESNVEEPWEVQTDVDPFAERMASLETRFAALQAPFVPTTNPVATLSLTGKYIDLTPEKDVLIDAIESLLILYYSMFRARTLADRFVLIATFAKLTRSRLNNTMLATTAIMSAFEYFCPAPTEGEMEVQSAENVFSTLQGFLDKYDVIKTSPLFEKLHKFGSYALALSLFAPLGITMDHMKFEKVAQEALKKKFHMGPDFVHSMLDTALFLTQRGYQCYQIGSIMPMFHSAEKYQEWFDKAEKLNRQSHFLSNPEVHGIDRFKFLADLKDVIECGQSMRKCALKKDEKLLISKMLATLELTHDLEVTKRAAQKDRKTPLCLLLYGGSGIGKSTLQNVMFQHYGKVRGLCTLPEFRYVRNPTEAFWSGMNSTQWCVVLDDIGFMSPRLGTLDPSLAEMLCIANNVPFVPAQAELSDKGRTPVRAELVLGSTNTEHLNLIAYFSCPLAVQRRFPWVIDVRVKAEFQSLEKPGMLDSSLVPPPVEGAYPDLWTFVIKRVVPCGEERLHQTGKLVIDQEIGDMKTFLQWYNKVITDHNTVQDKIMSGNNTMLDTKLCTLCSMPSSWCTCVQAEEFDLFGEQEIANREREPSYIRAMTIRDVRSSMEGSGFASRCAHIWYMFLYFAVVCTWLNLLPSLCWGPHWFTNKVASSPHRVEFARTAIRYAGMRVERRFGVSSASVTKLAGVVLGVALLYKVHGAMMRTVLGLLPQGGVSSRTSPDVEIGRAPKPTGPATVSMYADPYPYSSGDISKASMSVSPDAGELLEHRVANSTCMFTSTKDGVIRNTTAVNVRGAVYMLNNHGIPEVGPFELSIAHRSSGTMNTWSQQTLIVESMIYRLPERDLAFVFLPIRPPGYDFTKFMPSVSLVGHIDGKYIHRDLKGEVSTTTFFNAKVETHTFLSHGATIVAPMWTGTVDTPTEVGECGSPLIARISSGWVILGIHTLGRGSRAAALKIDAATVITACDTLQPLFVNKGVINISAPSAERVLADLSPQSIVHRVRGTADVIGSFAGEFRQRSRTRVGPTFIAPFMERYSFHQTRVAPDMGRQPWLLALQDMTRPVMKLNNDIINEATSMFIRETQVSDYSSVFVYDLPTAINGCDGLMYCDKINRKSSAGAPYKRSKTHFMFFVNELTTTDMDVVDEIKDTISDMITTYHRGERVHPIFCGHLKDEPVTPEKALAGKTRVFTAAGMAHTLLVRMYLLSVIVFMQKRRYKFETGPGLVAQSLEWEEARTYLTTFGCEKMVAGDYAKFDKRMPASVILATFRVIEDICRKAGYSDDDLKVVRGIAYDTAFPTVDFNGELIEFFGSNPSGHALTVIVNGLANCIYMRYTYLVLRPISCKRDFKELVKLLTYGDDNAMGVHDDAGWFNHTAIQRVLADVDIQYTMADKEAASVPYIHIDDVSFLKRTWRFDGDVGAYVAPLDRSSIHKMLTVCVQKGNVSPKCHAMQVIGTAIREYFFYGKEEFETASAMLQEVVKLADLELYVEGTTFPSWDQLVTDFWERSKHVRSRT